MERLTALIYQTVYKYAAQSVCCIISRRCLSVPQKIPQVCILMHSLRVSNYLVRAVFGPVGFQQMCGGGSVPIEKQGNTDMLFIERASNQGCRHRVKSSWHFGVQNQHEKGLMARMALHGPWEVEFECSRPASVGHRHYIQNVQASSTRSLYSNKWRVFEEWCRLSHVVPFYAFSRIC